MQCFPRWPRQRQPAPCASHGSEQHVPVVLPRGDARVGFVAVVGHGAVDDALEQIFGHAQGRQAAGQAQAGVHGADGVVYLGAFGIAAA